MVARCVLVVVPMLVAGRSELRSKVRNATALQASVLPVAATDVSPKLRNITSAGALPVAAAGSNQSHKPRESLRKKWVTKEEKAVAAAKREKSNIPSGAIKGIAGALSSAVAAAALHAAAAAAAGGLKVNAGQAPFEKHRGCTPGSRGCKGFDAHSRGCTPGSPGCNDSAAKLAAQSANKTNSSNSTFGKTGDAAGGSSRTALMVVALAAAAVDLFA